MDSLSVTFSNPFSNDNTRGSGILKKEGVTKAAFGRV